VGRFQERAGITVDEVYGPQTEAALNATLREQEGADELSWSERLPVPGWFEDQFPGNFEQGAATAQFYQTRAYGYARAVFEGLSQLKANQEAILAHQAGEDVVERVRQVLAENQEEVLAELSDGLASAVAAELGDRDPEAVEAAVTRALRRRDRRAAGVLLHVAHQVGRIRVLFNILRAAYPRAHSLRYRDAPLPSRQRSAYVNSLCVSLAWIGQATAALYAR
jgi:hypothetical protein